MSQPRAWLAVGGAFPDDEDNYPPAELFDEASGRWFELPHPMIKPRIDTVALPVAVLRSIRRRRQAQIAALAAQARDIGPWSAEEKEGFAEAAGWGS